MRPKGTVDRHHVLYLHGGAYVHQIEPDHWAFFARLIDALACTVTVPLYPLAPRHSHEQTLEMIEHSYQVAFTGVDPANRVLMGDSAGGGMSLVLAQRRKAEGNPLPAHIVLISPWLDITVKDPMVPGLERRDPYLSAPGLIEAGRMYAGDLDPEDPRLSPINGELAGLGRISVLVGTRDVLLADARRLRLLATLHNIDIDYLEHEDMYHGWAMEPSPEGRRARQQIITILQHGRANPSEH
jgi:acetyl esterase/lipase